MANSPTEPAPLPPIDPATPQSERSTRNDRSPPKARRPTLHLTYFFLAGLSLLTVLLGLYANQWTSRIHAESVSEHRRWADRLEAYDHLRRLASDVNTPARSVFNDRPVSPERVALDAARIRFDAALDAARRDLRSEAPSPPSEQLLRDLDAVQVTVDDMSAEVGLVLASVERKDATRAGRRLAAVSRKYERAQDALSRLTRHAQAIQTARLVEQNAAADGVRRFEWIIAALVTLTVAGATSYGVYRSKRAALAARLREHTQRLDTALQSEQAFRTLVEHGSDVILVVDRTLAIRYASPSTTPVVGFDAQELRSRSVIALVHPEDASRVSEHCRRTFDAPGSRFAVECRLQHADGSWRTVELVGHSTVHAPFAAAEAVRVILNARDVTERRNAMRALEASEQRFRGLVETMHELVIEMTPDGLIRFVNRPLCLVTGHTEAELIGSSFFSYVHPDDLVQTLSQFERLFQHRQAIRNCEFRFRKQDGGYLHLATNSDPICDDDGRLKAVVQVCFDLTQHRRAEETIRRLAYHDPLTDLPNRALLLDRLARAIGAKHQPPQPVALLMMDLDHFKDINNTLGHHHGDVLLQQLATRLAGLVRQADLVARLGGDEFALALPDTDLEGAVRVAEKVRAALTAPFDVEALSMTVEASIGIAVFPEHATSPDSLLQRANVAMYAAKESRSGVAVYASEHDHYNPWRLALMGELRFAIEHGELALFFQPKIHMATRRVIGVEALVRWNHPHRGMVPPDEFIPLAEQTGLIRPLTRWVLSAARAQEARLRRAGYRLTVAVNVSARTLHDTALAEFIATLLHPDQPSWLELEITESAIMADPARSLDVLKKLHEMNIPLAIDDFGTGYSSLAYLKKLPIGTIKIDKSFVKNLATDDNDAAIVRSTIEMGHHLGLVVVAEGVETAEAWDHLARSGCDSAQGYYVCRPMPDQDLERWLRNAPWQIDRVTDPTAHAA
jgi:diguanylate cyclase (GGDEF)-like protein/PAS domain S-box-containing protein